MSVETKFDASFLRFVLINNEQDIRLFHLGKIKQLIQTG